MRGGGETHDWGESDGHEMPLRGQGNKIIAETKARNVWGGRVEKKGRGMIGDAGGR